MELILCVLAIALCVIVSEAGREIKVTNNCGYPIWTSAFTNLPVKGGAINGVQKLAKSSTYVYQIPQNGWGGRIWPKTGCDGSGHNCATGQSTAPCLKNGCDPPAETKVEFFYPPVGDRRTIYYDISLVDGYSLPVEIIPSVKQGNCVTTKCAVPLSQCPQNEKDVGDLRVMKNGRAAFCLAPCKKWNYPKFGLNKPENIQPGLSLCCPAGVTVEQCRRGPIEKTKYVALVRRTCPTAYSYSYDDLAGNHDCPNPTNFQVTFCP